MRWNGGFGQGKFVDIYLGGQSLSMAFAFLESAPWHRKQKIAPRG
jgi:hypothetical protein